MAAISNVGVKLAGSHAGVSIGEDGPSQMALEDLAMCRGAAELSPCSTRATPSAPSGSWRWRPYHPGPAYIRTSRPKTPVIYGNDETFPIGGLKVLRAERRATSATVIGAGVTVFEALKAYDAAARRRHRDPRDRSLLGAAGRSRRRSSPPAARPAGA